MSTLANTDSLGPVAVVVTYLLVVIAIVVWAVIKGGKPRR